jgi:benzoyl-CoA reductase/2-hydroxyglutaryl-CoA dehydratase subunit BcrC/BadD/HgdB
VTVNRWDVLEASLVALDRATAPTLETASGLVLGYVGDDWTPPKADDADAQLDYLSKAGDKISEAVEQASKAEGEERDKILVTAKKSLDVAKGLAKSWYATHVSPLPLALDASTAAGQATAKSDAVNKKLNSAWQSLKDASKSSFKLWLAMYGTGVVIGLAALWLYLESKKPRKAA